MASNTTTRTRKPSTKVTTRKVAPKATAKTAAPAPKVRKADIPEDQRDWTYLAEKDPTALHQDFAVWLEQEIGVEMDLKTVQAVCVLRMVFQRSAANKSRADYRPLAGEVVEQRSIHMVQAHQDARKIREEQASKADAKKKAAAAKRAATVAAKKTAKA